MPKPRWFYLLLLAIALLGSCKKNNDDSASDEAVTPPSAATLSAVAPATAAPSATVATTTPTAAPKPHDDIADYNAVNACCTALRGEAMRPHVRPADKAHFESAALTCSADAELVRRGTTTRAAALTAVRGAAHGAPMPAACP